MTSPNSVAVMGTAQERAASPNMQSPTSVHSQCLRMFVPSIFVEVNPCITGAIPPEACEYKALLFRIENRGLVM